MGNEYEINAGGILVKKEKLLDPYGNELDTSGTPIVNTSKIVDRFGNQLDEEGNPVKKSGSIITDINRLN
ncbi:MAG: hypothetical protein V4665_00395 [Patescibacteria group bacterium]